MGQGIRADQNMITAQRLFCEWGSLSQKTRDIMMTGAGVVDVYGVIRSGNMDHVKTILDAVDDAFEKIKKEYL